MIIILVLIVLSLASIEPFNMYIKLLFFLSPILVLSQANDICGIWLEEQKRSHIEIYQTTEGLYEGKIVWLLEPLENNGDIKRDTQNPDKNLRNMPLEGLIIIENLNYVNKNEWGNGTIYDARSGKTYSLNAYLEDKNNLFMRGYMGFSFIGKTTSWTRVN